MRRHWLLVLLALSSMAALACPTEAGSRPPTARTDALPRAWISIGIQRIAVEVAETGAQKSQGLSDRATLPQGTGMWFPYPAPRQVSFWMRDMQFALDFVWVRDGTIVALTEKVSPAGGEGTQVRPRALVDGVLEVPAGTIARWGWTVGMEVEILPNDPAVPGN